MPQKIEISAKTIIFTALFVLSLGLIWQIRELVFSLFIAFIIAGALHQPVDYLEKKKINRSLSSFLIYFLFIFSIFFLFTLIIPPLASEIIILSKNLPHIVNQIAPTIPSFLNLDFLSRNIPNLTSDVVSFIKNIFSNLVFVTSTLFFGFYFLLEKNVAQKLLESFFEDPELNKINYVAERAQKRMAGWFWGEIVLMIVVGLLTYIGLSLMGIKYALALSVLSGLLEVVPNIGPIIATIPAFLIGLSQSQVLGASTIGLYLIVQQLENNLIVPVIMKKAVGIHPIITLIALMVGGKIAGVLGVILAIPTTIFIETILIEVTRLRKK